ncbi:16S rRNA (cytidine(1402)-2'-O)-methyltransferase [Carboxydothermus pertinax]|uniref:Ribosomal RNA small subunit methyltransferase I n=1 Tax=Carboxydothermus pertinax TaxID=870242 RepID=A0A1L8CVP0_9THEO|nr:16S rRNA (cytidine(1402)-2'-O)-methyltransferase [Carboxydothermus pertinax]GAV22934.1 rRNA (cytidine-2'-O-)-methyltransferase [Carboxydothermus pertinax]
MGILYLVPTPLGNLKDITLRALETLKEVDFIAAEDTRHTLKLLNHYEIKKPLLSYHEHNRREAGKKILELLAQGKKGALVTDAGTPGISDPGEDIVREALEWGHKVEALPGASALIVALAASGLNTSRFCFEGFLPRKAGEREKVLKELAREQRTLIFYEAPHRLLKTLEDLAKHFGESRQIVVARELTKIHEEYLRGRVVEILSHFNEIEPKGEFVLVVEGAPPKEKNIEEFVRECIEKGLSQKEAVSLGRELGFKKNEIYNLYLQLK